MSRTCEWSVGFVLAVSLACDAGTGPVSSPSFGVGAGALVAGIANAGGHYEIPDLVVQFSLSATGYADGSATGRFHHRVTSDGELVEFHGVVICLPVDAQNHRAWVGGVITQNNSTDPAFQTPIHQPGRDIWFRVVDYGSGDGAPPDRTTFTGFEGSGGIQTSLEYCALRIWPPDDARTWPVTGNVVVQP